MKVMRMVNWLVELGARIEGLELVYDDGEIKGAVATRHILGGSPVLSIPLTACIYNGMYHPSKEMGILSRMPDLDPKVSLAFLLLVEKSNPHSAFAPYLDLVFNYHQTSPLYYSQQELSMLSGTLVLGMRIL